MAEKFIWKFNQENDDLSKCIDAFSEFLDNNHVKAKDSSHLCLIIDELISNIKNHGCKEGSELYIDVQAYIAENTIYIAIIDSGIAFNPTQSAAPDITSDLENRPIGGLGLHLVKSFVSSMQYQYENGVNILKIEKKLELSKDI